MKNSDTGKYGKADAMAVLNETRTGTGYNHRMETAKTSDAGTGLRKHGGTASARDKKYLIKAITTAWWYGERHGHERPVNEGDTLCTVISKQQGNPLGTSLFHKTKWRNWGDKVNIELNKYPTHSYGVLPGK